ncbi:unnamed protein product, partial [Mesorhabditis belari]|uniref:Nematode cuticle collagen N-terminal domain-containing protein n=1 Tax=Mesorhabditis belari TaxID=2138241 RepID=A0AAF3FFH4_9BILA
MLSAHSAGQLAIICSIGAVVTVFLYVPALIMKINAINERLKIDSDEFRVMADATWGQLVNTRRMPRSRRQSYDNPRVYPLHTAYVNNDAFVESPSSTCSCQAQNSCPAGPPGSPGKAGMDGQPGLAGEMGSPGLAGIAPPVTIDPNQGCRVCPNGPRGMPGPPGESGPPGQDGQPGNPGRPGEQGREGYGGNPGIPGEAGKSGKVGEQGPPGRDGTRGAKGPQGPKGDSGPLGQKGPEGYPGPDGQRGQDGDAGPVGPPGIPGMPGEGGQPGMPGTPGLPGSDGQYCKCPPRSAGVNKPATYETQPAPYDNPSAGVQAASSPPSYAPNPYDAGVEAAPRNPYRKWKWH